MLARITFRNRSGKSQALASALKGRRYHKEFLNQKHGRGAHSRVRLELLEKYEARLLGSKASGLGSLRISRAVLAETPREACRHSAPRAPSLAGKKPLFSLEVLGIARIFLEFLQFLRSFLKGFWGPGRSCEVLGGPGRS